MKRDLNRERGGRRGREKGRRRMYLTEMYTIIGEVDHQGSVMNTGWDPGAVKTPETTAQF